MKTSLKELKPKDKPRIMDLISQAGINVSDWANFKGGNNKAASNPKYCYEWSFAEENRVVVLNLWFESLSEVNGVIECKVNMKMQAEEMSEKASWKRRSLSMDAHIQMAYRCKLPVRVVINDGDRRKEGDPKLLASKVKMRLLDSVPWAISIYDVDTGQCRLTRGAQPERYVDQFSANEKLTSYETTGKIYVRSAEVRSAALQRAMGKCELCNEAGFVMGNGNIYLESHHVIPLSEKGNDDKYNVVAICPNHHREAHYGANKNELRERFINYLKEVKGSRE